MKLIILWTDALIYLLVLFATLFALWARHYAPLYLAWRSLLRKRLAVVAMVVLGFYVTLGLLDSIHFEVNQGQGRVVKSVFDYLISPLGQQDEKTYSAPLSDHLYTKELIVQPDGKVVHDYPQLQFPHRHLLGTDKVGQDVFYKTLKSIRTGLVIGTLTTLVMLPFAVTFGLLAGYFRGKVDDVIQYIYTTLSSIPDVLLIAATVLALQIYMTNHEEAFSSLIQSADMRLLALCVILGITSWTYLCRLLRGETLKLREQDYVQVAIALGVSRAKILMQHILPNLMHLIVITVVLDFSGLVLAEAVLTYVGVGVDAATISWGNMINQARFELAREPVVWWPLLAAFLFMFPLIIFANLFTDAVRDALDPRLRGSER